MLAALKAISTARARVTPAAMSRMPVNSSTPLRSASTLSVAVCTPVTPGVAKRVRLSEPGSVPEAGSTSTALAVPASPNRPARDRSR
jgi:hypothetical protein